jgi:hypothetical protein
MKKDILVEGFNWNVSSVNANYKTEEDFVVKHIDDKGTYPSIADRTKKEETLKLAYQQVQANTTKVAQAVSKP